MCSGRASTTSRTSASTFRTTPSPSSPEFPDRANRVWRLTRFTPRGSGATSNRFRRTRGNFSSASRNPMWTRLPESLPAIAIKQKNSTRNPRSTVATATEIYDYLRLLYARAGRTFCTKCGSEVRKDTMDEIAARVLALPQGRRFYVLYTLDLAARPAACARCGAAAKRGEKSGKAVARNDPAGAGRFAAPRISAALSSGPRARIFVSGNAARHRFFAAGVCRCRPARHRSRHALAARRFGRDLLSRRTRRGHPRICAGGGGRTSRNGWCSTSGSSARRAARCIRSRSRDYFRSTIRTARARAARDLEIPSISTSIW